MGKTAIVLARRVDSRIFILRGHKVILDSDLAELYGVSVKRLNEQIKRNSARFPSDFLFRLTSPQNWISASRGKQQTQIHRPGKPRIRILVPHAT